MPTLSVSLSTGFWNFPACSKRDVLDDRDRRQSRMIREALMDRETQIEQVNPKTFIVFSEHEALLVETHKPSNTLMLFICHQILNTAASLS